MFQSEGGETEVQGPVPPQAEVQGQVSEEFRAEPRPRFPETFWGGILRKVRQIWRGFAAEGGEGVLQAIQAGEPAKRPTEKERHLKFTKKQKLRQKLNNTDSDKNYRHWSLKAKVDSSWKGTETYSICDAWIFFKVCIFM